MRVFVLVCRPHAFEHHKHKNFSRQYKQFYFVKHGTNGKFVIFYSFDIEVRETWKTEKNNSTCCVKREQQKKKRKRTRGKKDMNIPIWLIAYVIENVDCVVMLFFCECFPMLKTHEPSVTGYEEDLQWCTNTFVYMHINAGLHYPNTLHICIADNGWEIDCAENMKNQYALSRIFQIEYFFFSKIINSSSDQE